MGVYKCIYSYASSRKRVHSMFAIETFLHPFYLMDCYALSSFFGPVDSGFPSLSLPSENVPVH